MMIFYLIKDDQVYSGEYAEADNFITVYSNGASKAGQLNNMKPISLACFLLSHLIREGSALPEKSTIKKSIGGRKIIQVTEIYGGQEDNAFLVAVFDKVVEVCNTLEEAEIIWASLDEDLEHFESTL